MLDKNDVYAEYIKTQIESTKMLKDDKEALKDTVETLIDATNDDVVYAEQKMLIYATQTQNGGCYGMPLSA